MAGNAERPRPRPRILLTGVSGQLGWELRRALMPLGDLICTAGPDQALRGTEVLDLADADATRAFVRRVSPDFVVNPAAYTRVDNAEDEVPLARGINAVAPAVLAEEARRCGALMVHYSTDYVFDGQASRPYNEHYPPSPINVYGQTKLDGELAIQASGVPHLILRTSWLYGGRGNNFLLTILRLAARQGELRVVDDQTGAPTWARQVAEATAQILAQGTQLGRAWIEERAGVYHLTAGGSTTWFGFARAILQHAEGAARSAKLVPIPTVDFPTRATRPTYSVLDCGKTASVFHLELSPWEEQLARVMEEVNPPPGVTA
jgi:dTDP-4-dehydrorhamnose reductase